ncbi:MAG: HIT domain-containing protein [Holosporaceae bacterium]
MRLSLMGIACAFLLCVAVTTSSAVAASLGVYDVWVMRDDTFKTWVQQHIGPYKGAQVLFKQKAKGRYDVEVVPYTSKIEQAIWKEAAYPNNAFTPYLTHPKSALFATKHSLLIRSISGNLLVIPQKPYVTLAGFLNNATPDEQSDLWTLWEATFEALQSQGITARMTVHMGSNGAQTVPHLHCRLEVGGADIQLASLISRLKHAYHQQTS